MRKYKDKNLAALLAFFGGIAGLQRFYLGQNGKGFLMIFLSIITMGILGSIIGVIDSIVFLTMSEEAFDLRYNNPDEIIQRSSRYKSYERKYKPHRNAENSGSSSRRDRRMNRSEYRERKREKERNARGPYRSPTRRSSPGKSKAKRKKEARTIDTLKEAGIEKFKEYDIEGSIQDFKKILDIDPFHIAAHFNLACGYSQLEKPQKSMYHLSLAVQSGFNDFDRIRKHDKLAYARIQPEWEDFVKGGFIFDTNTEKEVHIDQEVTRGQLDPEQETTTNEDNNDRANKEDLLGHLQKLKEQREKGIITEVEFEIERRKLMSS